MKQNSKGFSPLTLTEFNTLTKQFSRLLSTKEVPVIIPSEAILGIEAIAAGVSAPNRTILNIVTGPYGSLFGKWLTRGGARVEEIITPFDKVVTVEEVAEAIEKYKPSVLSFVQAEAITGGTNPTKEILKLAKQFGIITIIDSVSAIGAEPVQMDEWEIDFVAVGPQKALAGPNGVSAVGISKRGWKFIEDNKYAPRNSALSILDLKYSTDSIENYRVPANIPVLEARNCIDAFTQIEEEGLINVNRRHQLSSMVAIAGVEALGIEPWQRDKKGYSPLNTAVKIPDGSSIKLKDPIGIVAPGDGELVNKVLRINHYGVHANLESVEEAIVVLAELFGRDSENALKAVRKVWGNENGK